MFKPRFEIAHTGSMAAIIDDAGRGRWEVESAGDWSTTFTGFNGENQITLHHMLMQDGSLDLVLVSSMVDNPAKVFQERLPRPADRRLCFDEEFNSSRITEWVELKLAELNFD